MLKRNWRTIVIFIALLTDTLALVTSAILAYIVRGFFPNLSYYSTTVFLQFSAFLGLSMIFSALIIGVYRVTLHSNTKRLYFLASKAYLYSVLILFSVLFLFQYSDFPRRFTIIFFLLLPCTLRSWQSAFKYLCSFYAAAGVWKSSCSPCRIRSGRYECCTAV